VACLAVLSRRSLARRRKPLGEGGLKKFSRFEIFQELRPEFPGMTSEDKHNPKGKNKNQKEKHL
jgi:hypothetical protein